MKRDGPIRTQVREFVLSDGTVQKVRVKIIPPKDASGGATRQSEGRISNKSTR